MSTINNLKYKPYLKLPKNWKKYFCPKKKIAAKNHQNFPKNFPFYKIQKNSNYVFFTKQMYSNNNINFVCLSFNILNASWYHHLHPPSQNYQAAIAYPFSLFLQQYKHRQFRPLELGLRSKNHTDSEILVYLDNHCGAVVVSD